MKTDPLFSRSYKINDDVVYLNDLDGGLLLLHLKSGVSFKSEGLAGFVLPHLKPGIIASDAIKLFSPGFEEDAGLVKEAKKIFALLIREKFIVASAKALQA